MLSYARKVSTQKWKFIQEHSCRLWELGFPVIIARKLNDQLTSGLSYFLQWMMMPKLPVDSGRLVQKPSNSQ